jgi:RNA polymerase sigma-70 factor (sigma-E family)
MSEEADEDFVSFVRARAAALVRSTTLLVGDPHVAEDLVQTALERSCRKWDAIRRTDSPEAYVRKIIVNLANDRWSRMKRWPEVAVSVDIPLPVDAYGRIDLRDQLMRALFTLPIGMRTVLVLRYFDGFADNQIASMLGINPASVRSQITRGLAKLRDHLQGQDNVIRVQFGGAA